MQQKLQREKRRRKTYMLFFYTHITEYNQTFPRYKLHATVRLELSQHSTRHEAPALSSRYTDLLSS